MTDSSLVHQPNGRCLVVPVECYTFRGVRIYHCPECGCVKFGKSKEWFPLAAYVDAMTHFVAQRKASGQAPEPQDHVLHPRVLAGKGIGLDNRRVEGVLLSDGTIAWRFLTEEGAVRITTDLRLSIEAVAAMKKIMDEFASDPSCGEPFQRLVNEAKDKLTSSYQTQTAGSTGKGGEPGVDSGDPGNVGGAPPRAEKPKPKSEVPGGKTGGTEETP